MEKRPKAASSRGPAEWFTGEVWIDAIARGEEPSRVRVNAVHFSPGARTAWHSHALGQTLYVTDGVGIVQPREGEAVGLLPGDVVHAPAHEVHWHGATHDHVMTHLSITEGVDPHQGPETVWGEHVTHEEYRRATG